MTALTADYLNLNQTSGVVELFQVDMTKRGGSVVYLTPHGTPSGTVNHNGLVYTCIPMALARSKIGTTGTLPQPQLSIAVTENPLLRAAIAAYGDLAGCSVKRFTTFAKYLDGASAADPSAVSPTETFIINQMVDFNPETVTWKLVTPIDRPNILIPRLQYLKDDIGESATPPRCVYAPGLNRVME